MDKILHIFLSSNFTAFHWWFLCHAPISSFALPLTFAFSVPVFCLSTILCWFLFDFSAAWDVGCVLACFRIWAQEYLQPKSYQIFECWYNYVSVLYTASCDGQAVIAAFSKYGNMWSLSMGCIVATWELQRWTGLGPQELHSLLVVSTKHATLSFW